MSLEAFYAAIKPKVHGSWNLHHLLPKNLDFFILLSSQSGACESPGQANYACGNTYQDALARHRVAKGEKAVSLDLGVMLESGYVAEHPEVMAGMKAFGHLPVRETELLALLDYHCDPALPPLPKLKSQVIIGLNIPSARLGDNVDRAFWLSRPQYRILRQMNPTVAASSVAAESTVDLCSLLP